MHTLLSICRLCLLLLVVKTLAQDHRLRTPESDEHRTRRKPKWSHFFVMHEPRSEEKDKAQGFFYQVGSGPPVINRLRSSPSAFQSQTGGSNMARYNPVLHSPYPNRHPTHQQFGSRMPDSIGARTPNLPNPSIFNKPQEENPSEGTLNSELPPVNTQNFESGPQGVSEQQENFPVNTNAPLQFEPGTLGDAVSEVLGTQGQVSSHATLLQGHQQNVAAPDDSFKDSPYSVKRKPSFVIGGQSVFGKRNPLPSHLTPIIPPANNQPDGKTGTGDNSDQEREILRLSIAQHVPTRTGHMLPGLHQDHSERESTGQGLSRPDNSETTLFGLNRESHFYGTEIPKAAPENEELGEGQIVDNAPNQNGYVKETPFAEIQPHENESIEPERNLRGKEQLDETEKRSGTSDWQLQPQLNPQNQEDTLESFYGDPGNGREREPISHGFKKPSYQTQHVKESNPPHLPRQKYNYLPVSQQHAQANSAYIPPNLVNFNTNIHLHGAPPASPITNFQQEQKQPSHSLSVHPYVLQRPASEVIQPALQKEVQSSDAYSGRIPSSQIYLLRPSNVPEVPLVIAGQQNGPYRQDNRRHFGGEINLRNSQTPSHLTAIFPANLGHSKESVGQGDPQNIFTSNANEKTPNLEYSDILFRNQQLSGLAPSANPATNTASHSIRLLLPQQQLPQLSPTDVPSGVHHVPGTPNRFQTHQVNLLPNTHGYVQTQVQLPPLNFRFQLTPVKEDSNGSLGDISDSQKIAQPTFQPIPYQYQLPMQPVPIRGTHQILFPNLKIENVPLETPQVPSKGDQGSTIKSIDGHSDFPEKHKPDTGSSAVEDAVDKVKTLNDRISSKEDVQKGTEGHVSVTTATVDEISVDDKNEVLKTVSLSNNLSANEDTGKDIKEKDTKKDTEKNIKDVEEDTKKDVEKDIKDVEKDIKDVEKDTKDVEKDTKKDTEKDIKDVEKDTKEITEFKFLTPHETKTSEKSTTESKNADIQLSTSVVDSNEKELGIFTNDDTNLELTTKSQFSSSKPNLDLLSVLTFTEAPKLEDGVTRISDVTTKGTKLVEERRFTISGDLEIPSLPTDDSADKSSAEFSTVTPKAPTTISTRESTTLEKSSDNLADKSSSELSTTTPKPSTTVSTKESTTLEQSLDDKNGSELSTMFSETTASVSTMESATLEQSAGDVTDISNSVLSTTVTEAPATVSTGQSTTLEQSTDDIADKSSNDVSTTTKIPEIVSTRESTTLDQNRTTETELNTDGVSGTSDRPREIIIEESTVSNLNNNSITSTVLEHILSTETPEDSLLTTKNVQSSTDITTPAVTRTSDMSSISTETEIATELSETTSGSTASILPSSTEVAPTTSTKGTTTDSAARTSVSLAEHSVTEFPEEIATTTTTSPTSAETENRLRVDQSIKTEPNVLGGLEAVTASESGSELNRTSTDVSLTQTLTGGSVMTNITEIVSVPDISSTEATENASDTDVANEIEQFFTSPAVRSSSTSSPKIPVTTGSVGDKFSTFNQLSVFTFTEAPIIKRKIEKTNVETKVLTPEEKEKSKDNGTQTSEESGQTKKVEKAESDTSIVSTSVSKDSEISLNEISVVTVTTHAEDDAKDEEGTKLLRDELLKGANDTSLDPKLTTTKPSEDRAIFTFVGKTIPPPTEEKTEFSSTAVATSSSVSREDSKIDPLTEKVTGAILGVTTPNTEVQLSNQGRAVGNTNSNNLTSDSVEDLSTVLNSRERNENEVAVVESIPSNTTEYDSDAEVRSDTDITSLGDKEIIDKSEKEQTTAATTESENTSTFSSETPKNTDSSESFVTTDSETSTDSKRSDSSNLESTTSDNGNKVSDSSDGGQEMPMIIGNDALELLLNNLVTPRNISLISPVTSTSISIAIGFPSESPELVLDEDKIQFAENTPTEQNNDVLKARNTSTANKNEMQADNADLPESDNGSSFFSKVFEKSLLPLNKKEDLPKDSPAEAKVSEDETKMISPILEEKAQSESNSGNIQSQTSSPATEAPGSLSETQITSASVSPETEMPVSDSSSVKLTVLENFEGRDVPDYTEILKHHAR